MFILDEYLNKDCIAIGNFPLCQLLLKNDKKYPWFILVPRRNDTTEVFDLLPDEQQQLWAEVTTLSELVKTSFKADKINIAALGNIVSQLHVHVIARYKSDVTWPQPVWDKLPAKPYDEAEIEAIKQQLQAVMPNTFSFK